MSDDEYTGPRAEDLEYVDSSLYTRHDRQIERMEFSWKEQGQWIVSDTYTTDVSRWA